MFRWREESGDPFVCMECVSEVEEKEATDDYDQGN